MTKIIATFSNGHQDIYKGKRDVKAAWMIVDRATGEMLMSGHSLDRVKAQKTAESNVRYVVKAPDGKHDMPLHRGSTTVAYMQYISKEARAQGWDGKGRVEAFWKAHNAEIAAHKRADLETSKNVVTTLPCAIATVTKFVALPARMPTKHGSPR